MSFLLDTNAVSEWTKPKPDPGLAAWLGSTDEDHIFLSVVTLAEIKFGIERLAAGRRRDGLENWLRDEFIPRFDRRLLSIAGKSRKRGKNRGVLRRPGKANWNHGWFHCGDRCGAPAYTCNSQRRTFRGR